MTKDKRPTVPEKTIEYIKQLMLQKLDGNEPQEPINQNLIKDLMPQKDYLEVKKFIDKFGSVLDTPYERLPCGCMYIIDESRAGFQTWVYIAQCPICKISEGFHQHRNVYSWVKR